MKKIVEISTIKDSDFGRLAAIERVYIYAYYKNPFS